MSSVVLVHQMCERCALYNYLRQSVCNVYWWCMWCSLDVHQECTNCAKYSLICLKSAATCNFPIQQYLAGAERCVGATLLGHKFADCSNFTAQQYTIEASHRACSDIRSHGRWPSRSITCIRQVVSGRVFAEPFRTECEWHLVVDPNGAGWIFAPTRLMESSAWVQQAKWTGLVPAGALPHRYGYRHSKVSLASFLRQSKIDLIWPDCLQQCHTAWATSCELVSNAPMAHMVNFAYVCDFL